MTKREVATKRALKKREKELKRARRAVGRGGRYKRAQRARYQDAARSAERRVDPSDEARGQPCADDPEGRHRLTPEIMRRAVRTEGPVDGGVWATPSSEPYGDDRIWGAVCGRVWLGDPGDSELIARVSLTKQRIRKDELEREEFKARCQIEDLLVADHVAATGLDGLDVDRIEWLISWGADGHLLDRCAAFEAGYIKRPRPPASEMTLGDIKRAAKDWGSPIPKVMGGPDPDAGARKTG